MKIQMAAMAAVSAAMIAPASAQVTAVGEFAGEIYETFEGLSFPGSIPGPATIFGGAATVNDSLANILVVAFNWTGPSGEVLPFNGNLMGGLPAGTAIFDFANPVAAFGGYINTVGPVGGGTAVFYDDGGSVIDTLSFGVNPIEWTWFGWESDVGISRIEMTGAVQGFAFQFDDLTLTTVPTPGSAAVLALGACVLGRRRRA